jgi:SecD/SecF fusion protein
MKLQTVSVFLAGLLPLVVMAAGCGGTSAKPMGMVVFNEVFSVETGLASKLNARGMQALTRALDRRLNPGHRESGRVRPLDDGRIEVSIFHAEAGEMQRIADLLPRPGTLEFRILANDRDHPQLIARAKGEPDSKSLNDPGGQLLAWWVPARGAAEKSIGQSADLATRTAIRGYREALEVLVVKDSFDVTGSHLKRAAVGTDQMGKPCVEFALGAGGAQRFGDLTGGNLADHDVHRALGIILDGQLASAPRIMSKVSEGGRSVHVLHLRQILEGCAGGRTT